jgi:hypothetical protein
MNPGLKPKPFKIYFKEAWFKRNDILQISETYKVRVLKVYNNSWWKKLLQRFGFKFKLYDCVVLAKEDI